MCKREKSALLDDSRILIYSSGITAVSGLRRGSNDISFHNFRKYRIIYFIQNIFQIFLVFSWPNLTLLKY